LPAILLRAFRSGHYGQVKLPTLHAPLQQEIGSDGLQSAPVPRQLHSPPSQVPPRQSAPVAQVPKAVSAMHWFPLSASLLQQLKAPCVLPTVWPTGTQPQNPTAQMSASQSSLTLQPASNPSPWHTPATQLWLQQSAEVAQAL
jgi:hypothetical protein